MENCTIQNLSVNTNLNNIARQGRILSTSDHLRSSGVEKDFNFYCNQTVPAFLNMKNLNVETLAFIINEYLEEKEISARKFAKECKVSHQSINSILANEKVNPTLSTINKIMEITEYQSLVFHVKKKE